MEYISLNLKLKTRIRTLVKKEIKACKNLGYFNNLV